MPIKSLFQKISEKFWLLKKNYTFVPGEMAERSNAAVLKTVVPKGTGGSNPSFSAENLGTIVDY